MGPAGKAGARPSLGSAVAAAAVFQNPPPPPPSSATDSGVNRGGTANAAAATSRDSHEAALAPGNDHVSQGEGHAGNGGPTRPAPVLSFTGNNNGGNSGIASKDPRQEAGADSVVPNHGQQQEGRRSEQDDRSATCAQVWRPQNAARKQQANDGLEPVVAGSRSFKDAAGGVGVRGSG